MKTENCLYIQCILSATGNQDLDNLLFSIWYFIIQTMSLKNKVTTKVSLVDLPDLMTIREVADLLRISPLTIKRWGKKGKLPAIRINSRGDRRYRKEVILRLLGVEEEK